MKDIKMGNVEVVWKRQKPCMVKLIRSKIK